MWFLFLFTPFIPVSFHLFYNSTSTRAGTSGKKELASLDLSGSGSHVHLPLTALTKSSPDSPTDSKPDQPPTPNPSVPESPTLKRNQNQFHRGELKCYRTLLISSVLIMDIRRSRRDKELLYVPNDLDVNESKPHVPPCVQDSSSTASQAAPPPSLSASQEPTLKPGEYPFKRGEFRRALLVFSPPVHRL